MDDPCPAIENYLRPESDPALPEPVLAHAAGCPRCLALLGVVEEELDARPANPPLSLTPRRFLPAVAAAGLLVALATALYMGRSDRPHPLANSLTLPMGELLDVSLGEVEAPPEQERFFCLQDGSRFRLDPGSRVGLRVPNRGERVFLHLITGSMEAEVTPSRGRFRVAAEAGEVEVLGTRFWMRSFALRSGSTCLCVEVDRGKVRLSEGDSSVVVGGRERGLLVKGRAPETQNLGGDSQIPFQAFAALLEQGPSGFHISPRRQTHAELLAALLFGARWPRSLDLDVRPGDSEPDRQAKRILREIKP